MAYGGITSAHLNRRRAAREPPRVVGHPMPNARATILGQDGGRLFPLAVANGQNPYAFDIAAKCTRRQD